MSNRAGYVAFSSRISPCIDRRYSSFREVWRAAISLVKVCDLLTLPRASFGAIMAKKEKTGAEK